VQKSYSANARGLLSARCVSPGRRPSYKTDKFPALHTCPARAGDIVSRKLGIVEGLRATRTAPYQVVEVGFGHSRWFDRTSATSGLPR
jgi:hypothetical protein